MTFSNVLTLLLASILVVDNFVLKLAVFALIVTSVFSAKSKCELAKKDTSDIFVGCSIIVLDGLLGINLDYINFSLLSVCSVIIYLKFSFVKFSCFYNVYLLFVLVKGVIFFCQSL